MCFRGRSVQESTVQSGNGISSRGGVQAKVAPPPLRNPPDSEACNDLATLNYLNEPSGASLCITLPNTSTPRSDADMYFILQSYMRYRHATPPARYTHIPALRSLPSTPSSAYRSTGLTSFTSTQISDGGPTPTPGSNPTSSPSQKMHGFTCARTVLGRRSLSRGTVVRAKRRARS